MEANILSFFNFGDTFTFSIDFLFGIRIRIYVLRVVRTISRVGRMRLADTGRIVKPYSIITRELQHLTRTTRGIHHLTRTTRGVHEAGRHR